MLRFAGVGLLALMACGNTVIIEAGGGGGDAASTSRASSGSGGGAVSVTVGTGTTTNATVTTVVVASSSSGGADCFDEPDCPGCLCNVQQMGCFEYQQALIDNIYCGTSCGMACADFCINQQNFPPGCDECINVDLSQEDIEAFIAACESSPACLQFAQDLQFCP